MKDHPPIIYTTAYNEYALRGFKYNGLDYLLKPVDKKDLKSALEKYRKSNDKQIDFWEQGKMNQIKQLFNKEYKHRIMVKVGNHFKSFNVDDIAYFKSNEGVILLHEHNGKTFPVEYTIDQSEKILDPIQFFRINRKFMVSVKAVAEIYSYFNSRLLLKLHSKENDQVIVSRERCSNFKRWLDF